MNIFNTEFDVVIGLGNCLQLVEALRVGEQDQVVGSEGRVDDHLVAHQLYPVELRLDVILRSLVESTDSMIT